MLLATLLLGCAPKDTPAKDDTAADSGTTSSPITVQSQGMTGLMDAATDPKAEHVYFTATSASGQGIFLADGGTGTLIADGFETARSLVVNAEDNTLYVAGRKDGDNGIWAVSVDGGAVKAIAGSNAWLPQGLDLVEEQQTDMLYFTGTDPGTGDQGVWRVQLPDGAVQAVPGAVPVEAADGVARSTDAVYVVGTGTNGGTLIRIKDGASSKMVDGITLGTPAGIALTLDESTLLVSALADDGSSEVVLVNLDDASVTTFNDVIKANTGSGGVHRAKDENTFVWAGSTNTGTVYKIKLD